MFLWNELAVEQYHFKLLASRTAECILENQQFFPTVPYGLEARKSWRKGGMLFFFLPPARGGGGAFQVVIVQPQNIMVFWNCVPQYHGNEGRDRESDGECV